MGADVIAPVAFFAMIFGIVYYAMRKKERKMMIERGMDLSMLETKRSTNGSLKWGIVLIGIGLGIIIGKILVAFTTFNEDTAYFSMICLCGGLALVIYHFMEKSAEKNNTPPGQP